MRMVGMEADTIKRFLPALRRVGPGFMIYDCGRWAEALLATTPFVSIDDMLLYFGIDPEELEAQWIAELQAQAQEQETLSDVDGVTVATPHLQIVQPKQVKRQATLADAIEVWNESPVEIGRGRLQEELQARGLVCGEDLAKSLIRTVKKQLPKTDGAGSQENEAV